MKNTYNILKIVLMLLPFISAGQIPEGHFLDADDSEEKGYKIKPFIQKDKGIYHYNVLSELPFETNCDGYDSKEGELSCTEMTLGILVGQQIKQSTDYQGVAFIYFTVTEQADIVEIKIKSNPPSEEIDRLLSEAVNRVSVKPAKYNRKTVRSRLWTKIDFKKRN